MEENNLPAPPAVTPPITAELVSAEAPGALKVGDKVFVPIVLGTKDSKKNPGLREPIVKMFSQKELRFLNTLMETRSVKSACFEIGIEEATAKKWIKRPNFQAYIEDATRRAALAAGTDLNEQMAWLRSVRDGFIAPTQVALEASKQLSRFLKPAAPTTAIQINNLHAGAATASPYKGMAIDQLASEMKQRLAVIEATRNPA